jgi:hypothetical protein
MCLHHSFAIRTMLLPRCPVYALGASTHHPNKVTYIAEGGVGSSHIVTHFFQLFCDCVVLACLLASLVHLNALRSLRRAPAIATFLSAE